jgi:ABC-type amino acid transport substrate-binding protein
MRQTKILILAFYFFFFTSAYSDIKVGTLIYDPPFIISSESGFDIDLLRLLCKRLQEQCQLMPMEGSELYQALQAGKVDLAISGISISDVRKVDHIFSLPYLLSKWQFLTLKESTLKSISDLRGKTVGVVYDELSDGILYDYLRNNYQGQFKIDRYDNVEDLFEALISKTISAAFFYRSDLTFWNQNSGNLFKPLGPVVTIGEGIAIMTLPQKRELIAHINNVLRGMEKDNSYLKLYKMYFSDE